jgi:kinesin family protein C2/C3
VFEYVQPLAISVLDGYNVCIFAYGQTGSGKTHTMEGSTADPGVSPRAVRELFRLVAESPSEWTYSLKFSMLEVYNELILDLLSPSAGDSKGERERLDVRQTPDGKGVVVSGLLEVAVESSEQVEALMAQGQSNRAVGAHDMNEHSSRSHSILTITVKGKNSLDGTVTNGKLNLIDLAGSERISKTDATGERLKEAQNINKSLSALGDVIAALGNKKNTHVPYRNSKLTYLLQDSLGGNSKVFMFCNISPAVFNLGETICSLNFASRCRAVELGAAKKNTGTPSSSSGPGTSSGPDPTKSKGSIK